MITRIFKNCAAFRTAIPFCHFLRLSCSDDPGFFDESEVMVQFSEKKWLSCFSQSSGPPPRPTIDRQSALQTEQKENTDRNPFTRTFHPHNHVGKSSFLKTLNYFIMIQRLVLSFRNLHLFH